MVGDVSPLPGSLMCPVCGGARSVPGACCGSYPSLVSLPLGTGCCVPPVGTRSGKFRPSPGGGSGRCGGGVLQLPLGHPMMALLVVFQLPCRQVRFAVGAADSLAEPFPEGKALPCHTNSVGLFQVPPKSMTWLAYHAHCLGYIGAESHTAKDLR